MPVCCITCSCVFISPTLILSIFQPLIHDFNKLSLNISSYYHFLLALPYPFNFSTFHPVFSEHIPQWFFIVPIKFSHKPFIFEFIYQLTNSFTFLTQFEDYLFFNIHPLFFNCPYLYTFSIYSYPISYSIPCIYIMLSLGL